MGEQSNYTAEERDLILCITRRMDCKIGDCKTCGYTWHEEDNEYETIDGKWWLFRNGSPVRLLTDEEAVEVVWGNEA